MKTIFLSLIIGAFGATLFAEAGEGKDHPCREIIKSCREYAKGDREKVKSCMKTIVHDGGKIEGVNVGDESVQACKDKRAARKANKHKGAAEQVKQEEKQVEKQP